MSEEMEALDRFKSFIASISYTEDHSALAAQLGKAKSYWADVALSLQCVRACANHNPRLDEPTRLKAAGLLESLGLIKPVIVERRD